MPRQLKIAQLTTVASSATVLMRGWLAYLADSNIEVHAISAPSDELRVLVERERVSKVHQVPMTRRITPIADLLSLYRLYRLFRRERYDLVHASTPKGGLLGMIAAWLARVPVRLYTLRGLPQSVAGGLKRRLLWLTDWTSLNLAHESVAVSPSLRQEAIDLGLCRPGQLLVIGHGSSNGVDAARYTRDHDPAHAPARAAWKLPADALVVGCVGRLVRDKGIIELAAAWRRIRAAVPHAYLLLVGKPEDQDPLPPGLLDELRADERVRMPGWLSDTRYAYEAMDLFTLPTYREGLANVCLEANAMLLPVVATRITGVVDAVVDGETGLLVPARDADALADAIINLLNDPARRARMAHRGRERVLHDFQPEQIWSGLITLYRDLLQQAGYPAELLPPAPTTAATPVASSSAATRSNE